MYLTAVPVVKGRQGSSTTTGKGTAIMETMSTSSWSYYLFAEPSFLEGMARIMDFGDTLTEFNQSLTPAQANNIALTTDWQAVFEDVRAAVSKVAEELAPAASR